MSATGVAIVGAFFAAFGAGDVPKAMSLLGPEDSAAIAAALR